uniref:JAZF zinc finger 1 n=1 Tax=Sarcophilus harrisii TaxID=9305 RepID=A0A7N4NRG9_SARHA
MTGIAAASFFSNTCRFGGCGLHFPSLADLIEHIEDNHIDTDPRVLEKQELQQPTYVALSYINRMQTSHSPAADFELQGRSCPLRKLPPSLSSHRVEEAVLLGSSVCLIFIMEGRKEELKSHSWPSNLTEIQEDSPLQRPQQATIQPLLEDLQGWRAHYPAQRPVIKAIPPSSALRSQTEQGVKRQLPSLPHLLFSGRTTTTPPSPSFCRMNRPLPNALHVL